MTGDLVWSYSMLDTYESCPKKWFHKYILREKEPSGPALEYGNFVHKSIEDYLMQRANLPEELSKNSALIESIKGQFKDISKAELKMGVTNDIKSTGFFDKDVWGRGAADVALIHHNSDKGFIGDWKTGKKYDKQDQIEILAIFAFIHFGKLQTICGANIWLKDNTMGEVYTFKREGLQGMLVKLVNRLKPMYEAVGTEKSAQANPGFICNYCPVKSCKFNRS